MKDATLARYHIRTLSIRHSGHQPKDVNQTPTSRTSRPQRTTRRPATTTVPGRAPRATLCQDGTVQEEEEESREPHMEMCRAAPQTQTTKRAHDIRPNAADANPPNTQKFNNKCHDAVAIDGKIHEFVQESNELKDKHWNLVTINETWKTQQELRKTKARHTWASTAHSEACHGTAVLFHKRRNTYITDGQHSGPRIAGVTIEKNQTASHLSTRDTETGTYNKVTVSSTNTRRTRTQRPRL